MFNPLLAHYVAAPDSFDEMLDASRAPRPHWRAMLDSLAGEAPGRMGQRLESVQREVRENGVTYTVYGDVRGTHRPWDLNLLPLILPQDEWDGIEAAVIQRATLLNRLLDDVYGEQNMLREGLLPPALVHGHAGFLRAAHGMRHADGVALHFYAADLARAPDGRWWVVADRTQAPSGAAYALENRSIIGRTFPALLRETQVRPLGDFFATLRDSLAHWGRLCAGAGRQQAGDGEQPGAMHEGEAPLIVLLTPGPYNETYYEHSYLARYLGFPLVEGSDLTVRQGIVYLKTLSGLRRVHVVMRRVDDDFCDPLELRPDSALGVAGLTEAARRGNVVIANALGSSLLESGALHGFLPGLCQRLLGQPLKMPSVATWWCGEPAALEHAVARLDQLVIAPSFSQSRQASVFGRDLDQEGKRRLTAAMRANPNDYVAHELLRLSQSPVWRPGDAGSGGVLSPRSIGLRVYACATPDGYVVMPGGLTRVATGPDARVIAMQRGGGSKDTWVQGGAPAAAHRLVQRGMLAPDLVRDDTNLSSRMAENLFWLGRNTERCDDVARLLRVALNILFEVRSGYPGAEWPAVQSLCAWFRLADAPALPVRHEPDRLAHLAKIESALLRAVVSPAVPGLARLQQQLYDTAGQLRERLSVDNWRALNRMMERVVDSGQQPSQSEAMNILDDAAASLMMLGGFAMDGMTRDLGWRFLSLGRRIERLQFQCMALRQALDMDAEGNLDWLLELSDSIVTYRSRYRSQPEWLPVLDLLVLDDSNPRAIVFQLDGILSSLETIALTYGPCGAEVWRPLRAELLALEPELDLFGGNQALAGLLARIQRSSALLSEQIGLQFFSYTAGQRGGAA